MSEYAMMAQFIFIIGNISHAVIFLVYGYLIPVAKVRCTFSEIIFGSDMCRHSLANGCQYSPAVYNLS